MGNKIADAAKRLRTQTTGSDGSNSDASLLDWMLDNRLLANEWLAEHPEDDEKPVDAEWLTEVGFMPQSDHAATRRVARNANLQLVAWGDGEWFAYELETGDGFQIPIPATRGDVRRLCKCLGITIGGSNAD